MAGESHYSDLDKSADLISAFRLMAESQDNGVPRFPQEAVHGVARVISSRTYASAILELCHLVHGASVFKGGYLNFFYAPGPLRGSRFKGMFADVGRMENAVVEIGSSGIELVYRDARFSVSYGRMPFLSALIDFLVTAIGFADVDNLFIPLTQPTITAAEVSALANAVSRSIYSFLKDQLPPLQAQRKLVAIRDFLLARNGGTFDANGIDDEAVFEFWSSACDASDLKDFRTFRSVLLAFMRLRQVVEHADVIYAIERARSLSNLGDGSQIDQEAVGELVDAVSDDSNPLEALLAPPCARIKFFNAGERDFLRFFFQCGRGADALPMSLMRCEVFGPVQSQISQGLRERLSEPALVKVIDGRQSWNYQTYTDELAGLAAHGRTMMLASAYIIHSQGLGDIAAIAAMLRPEPETGEGPDSAGTPVAVISLVDEGSSAGGTNKLPPIVAKLLVDAKKAAEGVSRQGFRPNDLADKSTREGFAIGPPLVSDVVERIEAFLHRLRRVRLPAGDWDGQFAHDKDEFGRCFRRIYQVDRVQA